MRSFVGYCAALIMLVVVNGAIADLTPVGGVVDGGSWGQAFREFGVGYFDSMTVQWHPLVPPSGEALEPPTFRGLPSDWTTVYDSPTLATAAGSPRDDMVWSIWFTGDSSKPLAFDFAAFAGGEQLDRAYVYWSGQTWTVTTLCWTPPGGDISVVPLPVGVLLGTLGLGAAGLKLRRFA